jgi:hypothetical protein
MLLLLLLVVLLNPLLEAVAAAHEGIDVGWRQRQWQRRIGCRAWRVCKRADQCRHLGLRLRHSLLLLLPLLCGLQIWLLLQAPAWLLLATSIHAFKQLRWRHARLLLLLLLPRRCLRLLRSCC